MNKAEFERILRRRAHAREVSEIEFEDILSIPLPDDPIEFLDEHCNFEHIDTHEPVKGLRDHQRQFLEDRAACRWDEEGGALPGKDICLKFRRGSFTSTCLGLGLYKGMRDPGSVIVVFMQSAKDDILAPLHKIIDFVVDHFEDPAWTQAWRRVGNSWKHENKSTISFVTAGLGLQTAKKQARGSGIDFAILSEIGYYAQAGELLNAVFKAVPLGTGSVIAESTADDDREHPFPTAYFLTKAGRGRFDVAHFFPWFQDNLKRVPGNSLLHKRVMSPDFEVLAADLEAEEALGLDREQIAFRRSEFLLGDPDARRAARRENPEYDEQPFELPGETWLDEGALTLLEGSVIPPLVRRRLGLLFSVSIWNDRPEYVIVGTDNASREGRDYKAAVFLDPTTLEQVAEIHGRATDHEFAVAIKDVVEELVGAENWGRYIIGPERNKAKDLIVELQILNLHIYYSEGGATGKGYGVLTSASSRPAIFSAIADAVEGPDLDEDGKVRQKSPTWKFRSGYLVKEFRGLKVKDGKVQGFPHDDLAIAGGVALYLAPRVIVKASAPPPAPKPRSQVQPRSRRGLSGPG